MVVVCALCVLGLKPVFTNDAAFAADQRFVKYIILKVDDLIDGGGPNAPGRLSESWQQFIQMVIDKDIKANLGIIGSMSNYPGDEAFWNTMNILLNSGRFELWNHGWGLDPYPSYNDFIANQNLVKGKTGRTMIAVGMPENKFNTGSYTSLNSIAEIEYIMFGDTSMTDKTVFARDINIEFPTFTPDYPRFVENYPSALQKAAQNGRDYFCLQIHPNNHTPEGGSRQTNLHQIIDFLKAEGMTFVTLSEYTAIRNGASPPPVNLAGTNIALNKPVTASSYQDTMDETFPPINLVDGNTADASRWAADGFPQWAEIDLGSTCDITRFEVYTFQNRAYQYKIEVKQVGEIYSTVIDRSTNTAVGPIAENSTAHGRYVKLTVTGASGYTGSWVSIAELMVYGEARPSTKVNLTTTSSSRQGDGEVDIWTMQGSLAITMNANVSVYDILGKCVYQKSHAPGLCNIKHTILGTAGMYIVKIDNGASSVTRGFHIAR